MGQCPFVPIVSSPPPAEPVVSSRVGIVPKMAHWETPGPNSLTDTSGKVSSLLSKTKSRA